MSFSHTSPAQPHSEQPHSTPDPPETSSLGDSANHQPAYWEGALHHQMANPKRLKQNSSTTRVMQITLVCVSRHSYHHSDAIFLQRRLVIGDITDPDDCGGAVTLQVLREEDGNVKTWLTEWMMIIYAKFWKDTFIFGTSIKELSVLSVGLCVIRNLMFLWHSSTGAGRFMVARGPSDLEQYILLFTETTFCKKNLRSFKKRNTLQGN